MYLGRKVEAYIKHKADPKRPVYYLPRDMIKDTSVHSIATV